MPGDDDDASVELTNASASLLTIAYTFLSSTALEPLNCVPQPNGQRTLRTAAAQFATEFDTELSRALVSLQVDGATIREENWTSYAQRYSAWTANATEPRLVREVLTPESHRFLVKQGHDSVVVELDLSGMDDALSVLSGRTETVALLDRLRAETGDAYAQWRDPFHDQRRFL